MPTSATYYNPNKAPDPKEWLALDEHERIRLARNYHLARRAKPPDVKSHALFHAVIETQIAQGFGPSCRAVERLQREGLTRHDAIHAVAWVLADYLFALQKNAADLPQAQRQKELNQAIDALSADSWRRAFDDPVDGEGEQQ